MTDQQDVSFEQWAKQSTDSPRPRKTLYVYYVSYVHALPNGGWAHGATEMTSPKRYEQFSDLVDAAQVIRRDSGIEFQVVINNYQLLRTEEENQRRTSNEYGLKRVSRVTSTKTATTK